MKRSLTWAGHNRRMSKDYESREAFMYAAMSRPMVRRLARK